MRLDIRGSCELSSIAWYNSYFDRGMERVPLKSELQVMKKYKGHVMATYACMGGEGLVSYCYEYISRKNNLYLNHIELIKGIFLMY